MLMLIKKYFFTEKEEKIIEVDNTKSLSRSIALQNLFQKYSKSSLPKDLADLKDLLLNETTTKQERISFHTHLRYVVYKVEDFSLALWMNEMFHLFSVDTLNSENIFEVIDYNDASVLCQIDFAEKIVSVAKEIVKSKKEQSDKKIVVCLDLYLSKCLESLDNIVENELTLFEYLYVNISKLSKASIYSNVFVKRVSYCKKFSVSKENTIFNVIGENKNNALDIYFYYLDEVIEVKGEDNTSLEKVLTTINKPEDFRLFMECYKKLTNRPDLSSMIVKRFEDSITKTKNIKDFLNVLSAMDLNAMDTYKTNILVNFNTKSFATKFLDLLEKEKDDKQRVSLLVPMDEYKKAIFKDIDTQRFENILFQFIKNMHEPVDVENFVLILNEYKQVLDNRKINEEILNNLEALNTYKLLGHLLENKLLQNNDVLTLFEKKLSILEKFTLVIKYCAYQDKEEDQEQKFSKKHLDEALQYVSFSIRSESNEAAYKNIIKLLCPIDSSMKKKIWTKEQTTDAFLIKGRMLPEASIDNFSKTLIKLLQEKEKYEDVLSLIETEKVLENATHLECTEEVMQTDVSLEPLQEAISFTEVLYIAKALAIKVQSKQITKEHMFQSAQICQYQLVDVDFTLEENTNENEYDLEQMIEDAKAYNIIHFSQEALEIKDKQS